MRHVFSRALAGVCLLIPSIPLDVAAHGGQGLSSSTPAKEFIYLNNKMIAVEMAPTQLMPNAVSASQVPANSSRGYGRNSRPVVYPNVLSAGGGNDALQAAYIEMLRRATTGGDR